MLREEDLLGGSAETDVGRVAEATENGGADLDREAEVRQLWEAYDAPAEVVARPGWEGWSGGARGRVRGQRRRMGMETGDAAAEALATGSGRGRGRRMLGLERGRRRHRVEARASLLAFEGRQHGEVYSDSASVTLGSNGTM